MERPYQRLNLSMSICGGGAGTGHNESKFTSHTSLLKPCPLFPVESKGTALLFKYDNNTIKVE